MSSLADEITRHLKPLVGLRLSAARRAADMRNFHFGRMRVVERGTVGNYALHVQCPWRIEGPLGIVTGRSDLWEPSQPDQVIDPDSWDYDEDENLQDFQIRSWLGGYDAVTRSDVNEDDRFVVEAVHADDYGGISLRLSGGYRLVLFPDCTRGEDWRIFRPGTGERHFVVAGGRVETDSSLTDMPPHPKTGPHRP